MQADRREKVLKSLAFAGTALIIPILAAASVVEKFCGSDFVHDHIYTAFPLLLLWGLAGFSSLLYLLKRRMWRRPAVFCLHLSFLLILLGALLTHLTGRQGRLHLRTGEAPVRAFSGSDGRSEALPFAVSLADFHLEYYSGTAAPSDFVSTLHIEDPDGRTEGIVSMNRILRHRNYRFYQSGYDADGRGTHLSVSHDPCGIAVTYTGYLWLLLSIIGFFFERDSTFRRLLRHPSLKRGLGLTLAVGFLSAAPLGAAPRTLSREAAGRFCDLNVYYNDRVCPLQTLARDFTRKVCGKTDYEGLTPEQVLCGWFFFYDEWKNEPCIKIKDAQTAKLLGIEGKQARLTDFTDRNGYKLAEALRSDGSIRRDAQAANEQFSVISLLCTGALLRIYPYSDPQSETLQWYSLADRPSGDMPYEQWLFIRGSMDLVAERVALKDEAGMIGLIDKIRQYQLKEGGTALPSALRFRAEKCYNRIHFDKGLAMTCLTLGIGCFVVFCLGPAFRRRISRRWTGLLNGLLIGLFAYLSLQIGLRWFVSGHVPLANGFETMHFMAWCSLLLTLVLQRHLPMLLPFGFLLCGFTLLVAMMSASSPRIMTLLPVLQSPLLSVHVLLVMTAYTLLAFTLFDGLTAVVLRCLKRDCAAEIEYLRTVSRILLYPAVFCLTAGIFVGAVWANLSWGRYWGWDPKEVWALITLLTYASALHTESLPCFRQPMFFHGFCIVAFLSVLITYFGVNFLLGGMHSYA